MDSAPDGNSAVAESTGPTTFAEAFAADASSASDPSSQSPPPADAADPPTGVESTPASSDDRSPFIPRPRFDEVNTRMQAAEAWKQQHAWAEQVDRAQLDQAVSLAQRYQRDRIGFLNELAQEIQADPELGPQLRSMAARTLAAARGQQAAAPAEPQLVPVQLEDGSVVNLPRDPQAWLSWHQRQWLDQVKQEMAPAMTAAEKLAATERKEQATAWSTRLFDEVKATYGDIKPYESEIAAEVLRLMNAVPATDPRREHPDFLEAITLRAVSKVVLPKRAADATSQATSQTLDSLQRKAAAAIAPNPGTAGATTHRSITSFHDKHLTW